MPVPARPKALLDGAEAEDVSLSSGLALPIGGLRLRERLANAARTDTELDLGLVRHLADDLVRAFGIRTGDDLDAVRAVARDAVADGGLVRRALARHPPH